VAEHRSQRTEKPTARRLHRAREQGQVVRSAEIPGVLVLVAFLVFCKLFGAGWLKRLAGYCGTALAGLTAPDLTLAGASALMVATAWATLGLLAAPVGLALAAGLAGNLVQGPPPLTLSPLAPNWSRLNPVANLQRIVSPRPWAEMLKMLLKLLLYGGVTWSAAREALSESNLAPHGAAGALAALFALTWTVVLRVALLAALLAGLDWAFRRYEHLRSLMMTKKEVRDERRDIEGDPLVRARLRSKMLALARTRMMSAVPRATVVVTNPEHVAVALRYEPGENDVPVLLAKGRELLAARIRQIATAHGVPIVSDPPLARALYRAVPVGGTIPPALFRAVAEVLALVLSRGTARAGAAR